MTMPEDDGPALLVNPDDLAGFPGAPYADTVVASACASVRSDAGWIIAPQLDETVLLDGPGKAYLPLPTLKLVEVTEVRDVTDPDDPKVIDGWRRTRAGMLYRLHRWPCGPASIEVDLTHGYESCPAELLPVIAERCQQVGVNRAVSQETAGGEAVTYTYTPIRRIPRELARYQLPPRQY